MSKIDNKYTVTIKDQDKSHHSFNVSIQKVFSVKQSNKDKKITPRSLVFLMVFVSLFMYIATCFTIKQKVSFLNKDILAYSVVTTSIDIFLIIKSYDEPLTASKTAEILVAIGALIAITAQSNLIEPPALLFAFELFMLNFTLIVFNKYIRYKIIYNFTLAFLGLAYVAFYIRS